MLSYPVMLDLTKKRVVVIGGGKEASRILATLVGTGAYIRIVSSLIPEEYKFLNSIQKVNRDYEEGDIDRAFLIFICIENSDIRENVYSDLKKGQLVFDYYQEEYSDFYPLRVEETSLVSDRDIQEIVVSSIEDVSDDEAEIALKKVIEKKNYQNIEDDESEE